MSSRACATGHIEDPVPLIEKRRGLSPIGRSAIVSVCLVQEPGLNNNRKAFNE